MASENVFVREEEFLELKSETLITNATAKITGVSAASGVITAPDPTVLDVTTHVADLQAAVDAAAADPRNTTLSNRVTSKENVVKEDLRSWAGIVEFKANKTFPGDRAGATAFVLSCSFQIK